VSKGKITSKGDFTHLHLHTHYSLLDGAIRIPDLITRAKQYQMDALAVTDHGALFGAMDFYSQVQDAGIKPIIGCEVYTAPGSRFDHTSKAGVPHAYHLVLLCENEKGYRNLCRLVSMGYLEGFYYKPRIDREALAEHHEGLICLSGCLAGELPAMILAGDESAALDLAAWYKEVFSPDRYYLELQENGLQDQKKVNTALLEIAKKLDLKVVATADCHFLDKSDYRAHEILLCIQTGKKLDDSSRLRFETSEFYFKSPDEMARDFRHLPEALAATREIADRCSLLLEFGEVHMPRFDLGTGETLRDRFEKDVRLGFSTRMKELTDKGELRPEALSQYEERLEREIELIKEKGFSGYFLIVADFINFARNNGVPVGPGRGSAAGSLAAYCLGITDLDPIRYNLLFERFLNPERKSMPDIDVDFCMEGREKVIAYVTEKYGKDKVAQIITFGRMQAKAVLKDTARVLNIPYAEADRIAKLIPDELKITLAKAIQKEPALKEAMESNPRIAELISAAGALEGLARHSSTHAAGIVISDRPLVERIPLYRGSKGETLTQFDMTWVEKVGLVKFDFLGLKTLTVIDKALKLIEESRKVKLNLRAIPFDDQDTYNLISSGDTPGIFQLESSGMRDILTKFKPSVFEDLIAILALYRPGPLGSGMVDDFINRKHGRTRIDYPLPELEPILRETYGVILYQEQVMNIAVTLADYSLGEADLLRRAMGKKKLDEMAEQKSRFEKGAARKKIDPAKAAHIFELMEEFAKYGFNKSHSAAYAVLTYQTAYLKTHYPAEFMAALLTCESGSPDKLTIHISECRDRGIEVLPPHVNESFQDFRVAQDRIIFGLGAVKNVGEGAVLAILEAREEGGPFCDILDFAKRVDLKKVNKRVFESLIKSGAFDGLGHTRRAMMEGLDLVLDAAAGFRREKDEGQFNLFGGDCLVAASAPEVRPPDLAEWEESVKLAFEKEMIGFYITGHPLAKYNGLLKKFADVTSSTLAQAAESSQVRIAGLVKSIKEINTKKGDRMAFVDLEDLEGSVEVTVFSDVYLQKRALLQSGDPLIVSGVKEGNGENPKIVAQDIVRIEDAPNRFGKMIHIRIVTTGASPENIKDLKRILGSHRGSLPVTLHVVAPHKTETVLRLPSVTCEASSGLFEEVEQTFGPRAVSVE
jgi:DNA polymerase-3 subunit alpha